MWVLTMGEIGRESFACYRRNPALNKSRLDLLADSPALFIDGDNSDTKATQLGRALHAMVLESGQFWENYCLSPYKRGTAKFAAAKEFLGDRELITETEHAEIVALHAKVWCNPQANLLLGDAVASGNTELSVYGTLEGRRCKGRVDALANVPALGERWCVDLKTTASIKDFARSAWKYRYHVQAAWYLDLLAQTDCKADAFVFVAVETSAPYGCCVFIPDPVFIEAGRRAYLRDLALLADCEARNDWPACKTVDVLTVPKWAEV